MEIRAQILEAATRLFSAQGFDGTSLQEIADVVGIRKPSLLYHVKSKDELRRLVLEDMLVHWNQTLPQLLLAASSAEDQFDALVGELVGFFAADADRARLLAREVLDRPEAIREVIAQRVNPWVEIVCNYIRKGQAQGTLRPDVDPEAYIAHIINLVVASVASLPCIGALVAGAARTQFIDRHRSELLRMAKTSLFRPLAANTDGQLRNVAEGRPAGAGKSPPGRVSSTKAGSREEARSKSKDAT